MPLFPTRVLVGVDGSASARFAIDTANELCRATGSELHLLHVKTTSSTVRGRPVTPTQGDAMGAEAEQMLARAAQTVVDGGGSVTATHVRFGEHIHRTLVEAQAELDAGLLVIGSSHGGKVARSLFGGAGTAAGTTAQRSRGSVLVARGPADPLP
jgi:nucleotide-binding universal stress UspA family protein